MTLADDLASGVDDILDQAWNIRAGDVVPETDDVALAGGGVRLDATVLYSDLADSTELAWHHDHRKAAKVMKAFLYCASKLIRAHGGKIVSFDGDRVMAIYVGSSKNTSAAKTALKINYAMAKLIRPEVEARYPSLTEAGFILNHSTGIDTGKILAVRAGMRGSNDLVWIGRAPGIAAKLSDIRDSHKSLITKDVYSSLHESAKKGGSLPKDMWTERRAKHKGLTVYGSRWTWKP